jgi:hypothetical protein
MSAPDRSEEVFDPRVILAALERRHVSYVVIGALARVLHGADEVTSGVDICPQRRPDNLAWLDAALEELGAEPVSGLIPPERSEPPEVPVEAVLVRPTRFGLVQVVAEPAGSRGGWGDLRWRANREPLGDGLRPSVASLDDLLRMSAALDREQDAAPRRQLQRLVALERELGIDMGL